jgi:hypothetical protein
MIKVKIECWWTNSFNITDRVIKQFCVNKNLLLNITFVYDDSYDYLFIFGRPESDLIKKNNVYCFTMEPIWSPNNSLNLHEISDYVIIPDKRAYIEHPSYKEHLLYMLYGGSGELNYINTNYNWDFENLKNKSFNKNKDISFIVRNSYDSHYIISDDSMYRRIYKERVDLARSLFDSDIIIDIFGHHWEPQKNIHGAIWNKMLGLNDYKFSVSCENTIQKNYISEKFWDCILTDTIPIYFGCNNFNDYFRELKDFNFTNIINDNNEVLYNLNFILNNADNLYEKYLPVIKKIKNDFFHSDEYNILLKILKLINEN